MISIRRQVLLGQGIQALILIAIGLINVYFITNKAVNYVLCALAGVFFVFNYFQNKKKKEVWDEYTIEESDRAIKVTCMASIVLITILTVIGMFYSTFFEPLVIQVDLSGLIILVGIWVLTESILFVLYDAGILK